MASFDAHQDLGSPRLPASDTTPAFQNEAYGWNTPEAIDGNAAAAGSASRYPIISRLADRVSGLVQSLRGYLGGGSGPDVQPPQPYAALSDTSVDRADASGYIRQVSHADGALSLESNSYRLTRLPNGTFLNHNFIPIESTGGSFKSPYAMSHSAMWTNEVTPGSADYDRLNWQFGRMQGDFAESAANR